MFEVSLGSLSAFPTFGNRVFQKRHIVEHTRSAIWKSEIPVTHRSGTFDLVVFKVTLGPFNALVSKWPVTPNGWS